MQPYGRLRIFEIGESNNEFFFFCSSYLFAARVHGPPNSLWLADCFYTGQSPDVQIQSPEKSKPVCGHLPGSRLGVAVPTGVWASRCPRGGSAPSPLLQLVSRVLRREAAKACMLACVSWADHRAMSVVMVVCLSGAGVALALAWASRRRNCVVVSPCAFWG